MAITSDTELREACLLRAVLEISPAVKKRRRIRWLAWSWAVVDTAVVGAALCCRVVRSSVCQSGILVLLAR